MSTWPWRNIFVTVNIFCLVAFCLALQEFRAFLITITAYPELVQGPGAIENRSFKRAAVTPTMNVRPQVSGQ